MAPAGHTCRHLPQRMQASGLSAAARPELLQSKTLRGHTCRQRPQATQADWSTATLTELEAEDEPEDDALWALPPLPLPPFVPVLPAA